ncbi:MAG: HIT domain-containing protein [Mariprofundus sp.]|nr:HIT domain-containing protein [Mariprofundus sp.]
MVLHPQLKKDCVIVGEFPLCLLLLVNDANYPWFILVPQREHIREIHQLSEIDQQQLMHESSVLAECIEQTFNADKINIAALGNMVPQLHVHHIVRYTTDVSWPAPVWGNVPATPYSADDSKSLCKKMHLLLKEKQLQ